MVAQNCIYITTIDLNNQIGVGKKIKMQCEALENNGYKCTCISSYHRTKFEKISMCFPWYYGSSYRDVKKQLTLFDLDMCKFVYIRYGYSSRGLIDVLSYIKKRNHDICIIIEIPTYPYDQECAELKFKPILFRDYIYRSKLKRYVDAIVTFAPDKEIFNVPAYEITNGTSINEYKPWNKINYKRNEFHIIAVAGISKWHGFDRMIEGIKEYFDSDHDVDVFFHVVGDGPCKQELVELSEKYKLNRNIIFHGRKTGIDLEEIYNQCDMAIGSLGLHRVYNFPHVSVLKTREYCAIGIPFLTVENDYIYGQYPLEFCMFSNVGDTPICVSDMLDFYSRIVEKYSFTEITDKMRKYADEVLSWTKIYNRMLNEIIG